jgi:hypothetical protein
MCNIQIDTNLNGVTFHVIVSILNVTQKHCFPWGGGGGSGSDCGGIFWKQFITAYILIYIYRERERERDAHAHTHTHPARARLIHKVSFPGAVYRNKP